MGTASLIDHLESRLLLSATATKSLSLAVVEDRLQIKIDMAQFHLDCLTDSKTMLNDILKIKSDDPTQVKTLKPEIQKMRGDLHKMWAQLAADRLAEKENVLLDESHIAADRLAVLRDKGTSAESTAQAKLLADRIQLQTDMVAGLDARIATRQADYSTIFADAQAVINSAQSEPSVAADITKWATDRTNCMNTMSADLAKLQTDRSQLIADLTAMESSPT